MSDFSSRLDAWITSPRYASAWLHFKCEACGHEWEAEAEREYGRWYCDDSDCPKCGADCSDSATEEDE